MSYKPGMAYIDKDGDIALPHECDEWIIGTKRQAAALVKELRALIRGEAQPCQAMDRNWDGPPTPCPHRALGRRCWGHRDDP